MLFLPPMKSIKALKDASVPNWGQHDATTLPWRIRYTVVAELFGWLGGVTVRVRTCDQAVVGSIPGQAGIMLPKSTQPSIPLG